MIRSTFLALAFIGLLATTAQADFLIDSFNTLDEITNDGFSVVADSDPVSPGAISVEASSTGGTLSAIPGPNIYTFTGTAGESFSILYDFAGVYEDLFAAPTHTDGISLASFPVNTLLGSLADWTMTLDLGAAGTVSQPASMTTFPPIVLAGADQIEFNFEYTGAGASVFVFGGADLIATPEPTSLAMLGSVALLGLVRRRRR